ncbi:MAG: acetate--CoA ligase family protein [Geminicoccales bacterium]
MRSLDRLLRPSSIAVVGGGNWCANVIVECERIGFKGPIWPVHPSRDEIAGHRTFADVAQLPAAPDAAFIGVNREATIQVAQALSARGGGGAVCFASGFSEAVAELGDGGDLEDALVAAAGDMPILGPNCYGFINALDAVALWPDLHGAVPVERGVAIVTQSSNMALTMTMQCRGLPIAYTLTAGNQAQTGLAEIGIAALEDPRVTALGLHIEGIGDLRQFEALAATARRLGKSVVALKVGASEQAKAATISHTASLAGSDAGAETLLSRLGIGRVSSPAALLETLKLLHLSGPLLSRRIASLSCSGGEASLMADAGLAAGLEFPPLSETQMTALRTALGPKVALANPLDYHTYIWGDRNALTTCFAAMMAPDLAMVCIVLDFPRLDRCESEDWPIVVEAAADAKAASGVPTALVACLPETMPEAMAFEALRKGILPFSGLSEAMEAMSVAAGLGKMRAEPVPVLLPDPVSAERLLLWEADAKAALSAFGLRIPRGSRAATSEAAADVAKNIGFPVVLKGEGIAHKTEEGAVVLGLASGKAVKAAADHMAVSSFLIEEMVADSVAELLVGVVRDPAHGFLLTLAAGGTLTEILDDGVTLLLPVNEEEVAVALRQLRIAPLLAGYRGAPAADINAIIAAVMALQHYVHDHAAEVIEIEINPLLCGPTWAIAADALIRLGADK